MRNHLAYRLGLVIAAGFASTNLMLFALFIPGLGDKARLAVAVVAMAFPILMDYVTRGKVPGPKPSEEVSA